MYLQTATMHAINQAQESSVQNAEEEDYRLDLKQKPDTKRYTETPSREAMMLLTLQNSSSQWEYFMNELEFE
jgi:hypothetical protein